MRSPSLYFVGFGAAGDPDSSDVAKDDNSPQTTITYYVLFGCFSLLACFGIVNIWLAQKIRKFSKPMVTFYLVSEMVILFRVLLFADPFVGWSSIVYVVLLISMPSYLYLIVGLSQVMLCIESIIKYKNFIIREGEAISSCDLKAKQRKNQKILDYSYIALYTLFAALVLFFSAAAIFMFCTNGTFNGSYFGPVYLAVLNILLWILLTVTTCAFV